MTKSATLSQEAHNIINNFLKSFKFGILMEANKKLMVSLYMTRPEADKNVLEILKEFQISLKDYMSEDEISCLQAEYKEVINYCFTCHEEVQTYNPSEGLKYLPKSLVELIGAISKPEEGKSIYLPFSGEGSFVPLCENSEVEGFEMSPRAWALSQIVLNANNPKGKIALRDFNPDCATDEKFDYIFTFPPFFQGHEEKREIEFIYQMITHNLKENGEFYAILPMSYCNSTSGWFDVRKIVSDNQYTTVVIALPAMLSPVSNINLCLVCFVKDNRGLIGLVDATSDNFFAFHDLAGYYKERILRIQSVIETIELQDEKFVWFGHSDNLARNLDMNPARYLISQKLPEARKGQEYLKVRELVSLVALNKSEQITSNTPLLGMKELSLTYLNCEVKYEDIPTETNNRYNNILSEDAILSGFMNGKVKVGFISNLSDSRIVNLRPEVIVFKRISDKITDEFLLRALRSELTEMQANAMATGAVLTRLNVEDFLDIKILVPSREEQDKLCKEDAKASIAEFERKEMESYEEFRQDMHMKKHAIGQTIFNLNNWWKILMKARMEGEGVIKDTATVGKTRPIKVSEIFDSLQDVISQLQQQINKFDRGNGLIIKDIALTEFIEKYIEQKKSPLFDFWYDKSHHHVSSDIVEDYFNEETGEYYCTDKVLLNEGDPDPFEYVKFAPEALTIIFDNIISNACSHGFADREGAPNIVKIELKSEGDFCVITIANNGKALSNQISKSDVFTYGKTSQNGKNHFGIGGYEINRLMKEFDGEAIIISEPESDFPITYKLVFHNTNFKAVSL